MSNPFFQKSKLQSPDEFPFPFPPYQIQKDFMTKLYMVLEEKKLGIFESPTGTGKSLSIICGVLRWLCDHEVRHKADILKSLAAIEKELKKYNDAAEDWLTVQGQQVRVLKFKNDIQSQLKAISENEDEIENIRKKFENTAWTAELENKNKFSAFSKVEEFEKEKYADDILLDQADTYENDRNESDEEDENKYENLKIYFCSRTHSQLNQFIGEVQKSVYSSIPVVSLASRQTFCVNPNVKKLKSLSLINEKCMELQKKKPEKPTKTDSSKRTLKKVKCTSGCPYKNPKTIHDLKEKILAKIHDVEELVHQGQQGCACPYYAARAAIPLSQLVVVPYNTLLHKSTREASKIKLKDNVVIIDEAHNLLDAIGNMHSSQVSGYQLCVCCSQLNQYKEKFEKLFNAASILHLSQLIFIIGQLISMIGGKAGCNPMDCSQESADTKIYTLVDFVHTADIDNFNLYTLVNFCRRSKLVHKLQGFVEKYSLAATVHQKKTNTGVKAFLENISNAKNRVSEPNLKPGAWKVTPPKEQPNNVILSVISFIECLTNHCEDGRIICTLQTTVGQGALKFLLLNPAAHFQDIVNETRSVVVAGGTMQPISEFRELLFRNAGADLSQVITFSCGHVIPPENILPIVVSAGPSGKQLDFSFLTRNTASLMNELGRVVDNVCNIVPGGVVCFFPSYEYEQSVFQHFEKTGFVERLAKKKKIFREPKSSSDVDCVLSEYAQFIDDSKKHPGRKPNGCLLFSVIGGKLSEGLNFSDDLGRCVIVVGLPYPNIKSLELQEKLNYLNKTMGPGSGNKYYENLCMKAVNQSIGRAVRHRNDYATVLLLDYRYSHDKIQIALPSWMKKSLIVADKFGVAFSSLTKFFKSKI